MIKDLRSKNKKTKNLGFTLIELLISISIISILSVVLSVSFSNAQKNGRDQRRITDLKAIQNAAEQYYMLSGSYPAAANYRTTASAWMVNNQVVLQKFPGDPQTVGGVGKTYSVTGTSVTGYCVCAAMENPTKNSNAENNLCSFSNYGYFCVKNQQ